MSTLLPDIYRSSFTFRIDLEKQPAITVSHKPPSTLNNARIPLESRCIIIDRETNEEHVYYHGAACKTERVGVERDIWLEPNADFNPIFSREKFLNIKCWDRTNKGVMFYPPERGVQPERQMGDVAEAFDRVTFHLPEVEGEELNSIESIIVSTLEFAMLHATIEFEALDRYSVRLDFPIKTINVSERDKIMQTDTGPVLFPDFSEPFEDIRETFRLSYVAFNSPGWTEFILQVPTPLTDDISVHHYSKSVRLDTTNRVYRLNV